MTVRTLAGAVGDGLAVVAFAAAVVWLTPPAGAAERICGIASWYGYESGSITASGARFNPKAMTAAMPSRKHLGERWRVHAGHSSVDVLINDVGPALRLRRIIDLSKAVAERIGLIGRGIGTVCLERLK